MVFVGWVEGKDADGNTIYVAAYKADCANHQADPTDPDDPTNASSGDGKDGEQGYQPGRDKSSNTGDTANPFLWMILMGMAMEKRTGILLDENVFINYNAVMLDSAYIRIGKNTKVGPNCQFYTPNHPMDYMERRKPQETGHPITIGEDCWLGGGVIVCPGVTIGHRCIIAAGSVVTKDIPDDSLAAGVPAVVKRSLKG
jgi:acetyltransferase-like isoleucine patch superfamily enzyme